MAKRGWAAPLTLVIGGLLVAACSSPSTPASSNGHPSTTASAAASSSTTTTSTTPIAPQTGPLQVGQPVPIPITANQVTTAEGPDGAVFVAPQDPLSSAPTVVWVVDGQGPAAIAEHMPAGVAALAADADNLYVASYSTVTAFNRTTGNQDGQWTLPTVDTANSSNNDLLSMSASGGSVLIMISQGDSEDIYRLSPGSSAAPHMVAQGTSAAFGPDGSVYYARTDNYLAELSGSGVPTIGPLLADAPNGLGGGVQFVTAVAGGLVWVSEPAGQGLDTTYSEYNAHTLALVGTLGGSTTEQIAGTSAGTLILSPPNDSAGCSASSSSTSSSCVLRVTPPKTLSDPVPVGMAISLLGPDPAVVANGPTPTAFELERLS
jgi:hypothetical protein